MRINVYSQELTEEVIHLEKVSNTGLVYHAAQLVLHSSPMLHHPPADDDRSAVTFWLPKSVRRREAMAKAFEEIARVFREAPVVNPYRAPAKPKPACCDTCRFLAGFECRRHAPAAVLVLANPVHHIASWPRIRDPYRESCGEHEPEGARPAP